MSLLNWQLHHDVANHHDFILKLKDFCLAHGWTIVRFYQNIQWASIGGGQFGFVAGTEDYLEVTSPGYGSQNLHFRFRMNNTLALPNNEYLEQAALLGNTALNTASGTHPITTGTGQWSNNTFRWTGIPTNPLPQVWFFGNNKFILAVIKCDADYCQFVTFGSLELYDAAQTQGNFNGQTQGGQDPWYNKGSVLPWNVNGENVYYNGARQPSANSQWSFTITTGDTLATGAFASYGRAVIKNDYSEVRTPFKQISYLKDTDTLWFALGTCWVYRINHDGLAIGEKVLYGVDEYLTFPNGRLARKIGIAMRIL